MVTRLRNKSSFPVLMILREPLKEWFKVFPATSTKKTQLRLSRHLVRMPAMCMPLFRDTLGTTDWEDRASRPTSWRDYISHLPWDSSSFFWNLPDFGWRWRKKGNLVCSALLPLGSQSCSLGAFLFHFLLFAVHTNLSLLTNILTHPKNIIVFSERSPCITWEGIICHKGNSGNIYLFVCFEFGFFWPALCVLFLLHSNTVSCSDSLILWMCVCIFTFMVLNVHCCLGLQQQWDQLLIATQSSMVYRRQPSHRHRLCVKIHIYTRNV